MGVKDQIRELPEYQAQVQGQGGQGQGGPQATQAPTGQAPQTVGNSLGPVLDWEKNDVEFWLQVAQVVLLYLLLRELRGGA